MQDSFDKKCVNWNDFPENVYGEKTQEMFASLRGKT
jgi:hypothetical protein